MIYSFGLCVCVFLGVCTYTICMQEPVTVREGPLSPWNRELQGIVSCHVGTGNGTQVIYKSSCLYLLNHLPSPEVPFLIGLSSLFLYPHVIFFLLFLPVMSWRSWECLHFFYLKKIQISSYEYMSPQNI